MLTQSMYKTKGKPDFNEKFMIVQNPIYNNKVQN
jgi:hypothetical protein